MESFGPDRNLYEVAKPGRTEITLEFIDFSGVVVLVLILVVSS